MKKIILSLFVAVAALALWSCGDSNTPSAVAEKSVKCLQNSDYEGYVDLLGTGTKDGKDSEEGKEQLVALLREKGEKTMNEKQGLKSYEVLSEEISEDGNKATVEMKIVYGNGEEKTDKVKLKKNDKGEWRIIWGK